MKEKNAYISKTIELFDPIFFSWCHFPFLTIHHHRQTTQNAEKKPLIKGVGYARIMSKPSPSRLSA